MSTQSGTEGHLGTADCGWEVESGEETRRVKWLTVQGSRAAETGGTAKKVAQERSGTAGTKKAGEGEV